MSCGRQCSGLPFRYGHGSCLSVVSAPLTPLRAAVPVACSHRLGGSTSCLSRQPHKACCCHSPLRSLFPLQRGCPQGGGLGVFTSAFDAPLASSRVSNPSRPDNYLSIRRADDGSVPPPSSARYASVRRQVAQPHQPHRRRKATQRNKLVVPSVGRAVSHAQNACFAHLRGQYQQPHPV